VAIPAAAHQHIAKEQQARLKRQETGGQKVVYVPLGAVLGGRQISDAAGRDAALQHLQKAIDDGLGQGGLVILV
jgi:hypothetical protein